MWFSPGNSGTRGGWKHLKAKRLYWVHEKGVPFVLDWAGDTWAYESTRQGPCARMCVWSGDRGALEGSSR